MTAIDQEKLDFLKTCDTGFIADAYVRLGLAADMLAYTVPSGLCRPFRLEEQFAGQAVTVQFSPVVPGEKGGRMFDVLTMAPEGSVIIMSGIRDHCYMGDVLARYGAYRGMAAMVAEGYIRDTKGCMRAGIPIFSRGGTTAAKGKDLFGITAVNMPLRFHNILVHPGDVILGDADGIIRIPLTLFDRIYAEVEKVAICEEKYERAFQDPGEDFLDKLKAISAESH